MAIPQAPTKKGPPVTLPVDSGQPSVSWQSSALLGAARLLPQVARSASAQIQPAGHARSPATGTCRPCSVSRNTVRYSTAPPGRPRGDRLRPRSPQTLPLWVPPRQRTSLARLKQVSSVPKSGQPPAGAPGEVKGGGSSPRITKPRPLLVTPQTHPHRSRGPARGQGRPAAPTVVLLNTAFGPPHRRTPHGEATTQRLREPAPPDTPPGCLAATPLRLQRSPARHRSAPPSRAGHAGTPAAAR